MLTFEELKELNKRKDKHAFISSRFAAKEAVIKAMPLTVTAKDFEIIKDGLKPKVRFTNKKFATIKILLSLSHSDQYSAAVALVL